MTITQVRLTEDEARRLGELAAQSGETAEALARRAVTDFLASHEPRDWRVGLRAACGIWAERTATDRRPIVRSVSANVKRRHRSCPRHLWNVGGGVIGRRMIAESKKILDNMVWRSTLGSASYQTTRTAWPLITTDRLVEGKALLRAIGVCLANAAGDDRTCHYTHCRCRKG